MPITMCTDDKLACSALLALLVAACGGQSPTPRTTPPARAVSTTTTAPAPAPDPEPSSPGETGPSPEEQQAAQEVARLESLQSGKKKDPEVLLALGTARARAGDLRGASLEYRRAMRYAPKDFRAPYNLGLVLMRMEEARHTEGLAMLERAVKLAPKNAEVLVDLGVAQRQAGRTPASRATLQRAIRIAPGSFRAQLNLGLTLEKLDKTRPAIEAYRKAASAKPDDARPHLRLGVLLGRAKKHKEAAEAFRRAVAVDGSNVDAQANLGTVLLQLGEHAEAARHLEVAARAQPNDGPLQMNLGLALQQSGQHAKSVRAYRRAAQALTGSAEARLRLGLALARAGDGRGAEQNVTEALRADAKLRPAVDALIQELGKGEQLGEALALTRAILAVFPGDKTARHNRLALESMIKRKASE